MPMRSPLLNKSIVYIVIPASLSIMLMGAYFSGVDLLQSIVSPSIKWMNPDSSREFGLLENLQNACVLVIFFSAFYAIRHKEYLRERLFWAIILLSSALLFLEETDYGLHIYELVNKVPWSDSREVRNLHNLGDTTDILKRMSDLGLGIWFVLFPLVFARSQHPVLRYICPDRFAIITTIVMVLLSLVAHEFQDRGFGAGGTIRKNISEFRELNVYYLIMIYCIDMVFFRKIESAIPGTCLEDAGESKV
jgi:hypothetical protein